MAVAESKHAAAASGGLGRLVRLARKELRESLRDRRTILTLVLMPLLLYPLLSIAFRLFFLSHLGTERAPEYRIGFCNQAEGALFTQYLKLADEVPDLDAAATEPPETKPEAKLRYYFAETPEQLESAVHNAEIHVGVR